MDIPPKLRNKIHRAHFEELEHRDLPRANQTPNGDSRFILATGVRPLLNIFAVSRTIYKETHGLFFADYFPSARYALEGFRAVQSFRKLPSTWQHRTNHALHLRSQDPDVGLAYAVTLAQVLEGRRSASEIGSLSVGNRLQMAQVIHQQPAAPISVHLFGTWDEAWNRLRARAQASPDPSIRCLPDSWNEVRIRRMTQHNIMSNSESMQCMHPIVMDVVIDRVGNTTWFIKGSLSLLDWTCVPKDLQVFLDKPGRDPMPNEAANERPFRIARRLELEVGSVPPLIMLSQLESFSPQNWCQGTGSCGLDIWKEVSLEQ